MNEQHRKHIDELVDLIASTLKATAQRLYHSGAIDVDSYSPDEFALAKILVTAALHQHKDDFKPLHNPHKGELKNLMHF